MTRGVVIKTMDSVLEIPFPDLSGATASGAVKSRSVIADEKALFLWVHELAPGASLRWESPKYDHLLYLWKGELRVDGASAGAGQVVVIEHHANALLEAGDAGATIVHFHQSESQPLLTNRAGGHVHVVAKEGLFSTWDEQRHATHTVWADAHCATCELWLHRSAFGKPRLQSEPHMHNEDEIIFVIEGGTIVGRVYGPGTAIAVAAGTVYTFGVAEGGTTFINFRATDPFVKMTDRGKPVGEWISEWAFMRNEAAIPVIDARAAV